MAERGTHERLVAEFYAARARRDFATVGELLADDIAWHEPGDESYSGTHRGKGVVVSLLEGLLKTTGGTFRLEPTGTLATESHVVATIRWSASRGSTHVSGNEIAVYRIEDQKIAEAWFHIDGHDPEALHAVFTAR